MLQVTRPQKRTINTLLYRSKSRDFRFHLYFPSFTFELDSHESFYAYVDVVLPDILFFDNFNIHGSYYALPFHKNSLVNKSLCIKKFKSGKQVPNMESLIDYFWRSYFHIERFQLESLNKWQEYNKITWEEIYEIFRLGNCKK